MKTTLLFSALLGAQHLLAAEQEGHALGGEDGRLGQQVEADEGLLVKLRLGHGGTERSVRQRSSWQLT